MSTETPEHLEKRRHAVDVARTEVHRRHRLRQMAEVGEAIDTDQAAVFASAKDELEPEHLLAAALGELRGREPGARKLVFDPPVAVLPVSLDLRDGTR